MMNTAGRLLKARSPNQLLRSLSSFRKVLPPELVLRTPTTNTAGRHLQARLLGSLSSCRKVLPSFRKVLPPDVMLRTPTTNMAGRHLQARLLGSLSSCRKVLPPELSRDTLSLTCDSSAKGGVCNVLVVGINHKIRKSCQLVRDAVNFLKPEAVFLGLCDDGLFMLRPEMNPRKFDLLSPLYEAAKKATNNRYESEFAFEVAYKEALKIGAEVILGDRDDHTTVGRLHGKMQERLLWHAMTLLTIPFRLPFYIFQKRVWRLLKNKEKEEFMDIILKLEFVRLACPTAFEIIVDERDQLMSAGLLEVAREHNSVVAVVGQCHLPGIQEYWKQPIQVEQVEQLLTVPPPKE